MKNTPELAPMTERGIRLHRALVDAALAHLAVETGTEPRVSYNMPGHTKIYAFDPQRDAEHFTILVTEDHPSFSPPPPPPPRHDPDRR